MSKRGFTLYELIVCIALLPLVFAVIIGPMHVVEKGIMNTGRCAADLGSAEYILSDIKKTLANATAVSLEEKGVRTVLFGTLIDGGEFRFDVRDGSMFANGTRRGNVVHMDVSIDFRNKLAVVNIALPSSEDRGIGVELTTMVYLPNIEGSK